MPRPFLAALLFGVCATASSALEWKAQSLQARTVPFQSTVEFLFEFKNDSTHPVTIFSVQTNCDCLDAATDLKIYQPGQSGQLKARFTVGDRLGLYQRSITVETDEPTSPTTHLSVSIEVPEIVSLSQRMLDWRIGSAGKEQTVILRPVPGLAIDFHTAQATNEDFIVHLKTIKTGEVYRLTVKPKSTKRAANAAIRISGRDHAGRDVLVSAYANVK